MIIQDLNHFNQLIYYKILKNAIFTKNMFQYLQKIYCKI